MTRNAWKYPENVYRRYARTEGCWTWLGGITAQGYGRVVTPQNRSTPAHLAVWDLEVGPRPEGLEPDHLCRNRACVRPSHLEWVTHQENVARGLAGFTLTGLCKAGLHDVTDPANVIVEKRQRSCRLCYNARQRRKYARRVAAAAR